MANVIARVAGSREDGAMMELALQAARAAGRAGEVPVGAVVAIGTDVLATAHNCPISLHDPTAHAEILALRAASLKLATYRLTRATIYVTLEPCTMCVGAIIAARIATVVYGAHDDKAGALGSVYDIGRDGRLNHRIEVVGGVMAEECAAILKEFFRRRR